MQANLLAKTRKLNQSLLIAGATPISFMQISETLGETLLADVLIISRKGKILGSNTERFPADEQMDLKVDEGTNRRLSAITETEENLESDPEGMPAFATFKEGSLTIVPILNIHGRLGTLVFHRVKPFADEDLVLAEYGATIVGMEIMKAKNEELEVITRKKTMVQVAIGTLSYSELEAIEHIFRELDGMEGLLVASKIADRVGITRSVIVNALRKFESAGVIESKSLGMKGTYIKVLNGYLLKELNL
jgi:transcriptional pleiotropic repressor